MTVHGLDTPVVARDMFSRCSIDFLFPLLDFDIFSLVSAEATRPNVGGKIRFGCTPVFAADILSLVSGDTTVPARENRNLPS